MHFELVSEFEPKGDQPRAIEELVTGLEVGAAHSPAAASPSPWRASWPG
jgi:excinuclease UvrABC helicase subunit UvrB